MFHVAARSLATSALSIFGDHSDVMTARTTGFALLSSASVQEAHDARTDRASRDARSAGAVLAFLRRLSHVARIEYIDFAERQRDPGHDPRRSGAGSSSARLVPKPRSSAARRTIPIPFFRREAANPYFATVPGIVEAAMNRFATLTGRSYRLFEYEGAPDAERVIVVMGSGGETARETVKALRAGGDRIGVVQVRLYRPFSAQHLLAALPASVRAIAVLEQAKEPGAPGEPLYLDVVTTLAQHVACGAREGMPRVIGGRYSIASKILLPQVKAVFDEMKRPDAEERLHRRHQRRRVPAPASTLDPSFSIERQRRRAGRVLRPWCRRYGRRQQEQRQDHRRGSER